MSALDDIIARDSAPQQPSALDAIIARDAAQNTVQSNPLNNPANTSSQNTNNQAYRDKQAQADVAAVPGRIRNLFLGGLKGAADLVQAPVQLILNGADALNKALPGYNHNGAGSSYLTNKANQINDYLKNQEDWYQSETPNSGAAGIGRIGISTVPFLLSGGETEAPAAADKVGKIIQALKVPVQGAGFGAMQPVNNVTTTVNPDGSTSNDFVKQKAIQMGTGAVAAKAGQIAGNVMAKVINPPIDPQVSMLIDQGVTPTVGQIMGGGFKRVEDAATSVPVLGDMIKNAQNRTGQQFASAAINKSLAPIGEKLPAGVAGRDAIEYAGNSLGKAYDAVLNKIGATVPDQQFGQDLINVAQLGTNLPHQNSEQLQRIINNEIISRFQNGAITSDGLKTAESNLGAISRQYLKDPSYDVRQLGSAIQEAQSKLRELVQRAHPEEANTLQAINSGYANFLRVQKAASSVGAENGNFNPSQLQNAVRVLDPSRNKGSFAKGDALMQDYSDAAKSVLGSKVPDSGTPFRHAVQAGIAATAGHAVLPASATGMMVPAAAGVGVMTLPYSNAGQKIAAALLTKRPAVAPQIANAMQNVSPVFGASVSPALLQALKDGSN
jgi:hypothetical protein